MFFLNPLPVHTYWLRHYALQSYLHSRPVWLSEYLNFTTKLSFFVRVAINQFSCCPYQRGLGRNTDFYILFYSSFHRYVTVQKTANPTLVLFHMASWWWATVKVVALKYLESGKVSDIMQSFNIFFQESHLLLPLVSIIVLVHLTVEKLFTVLAPSSKVKTEKKPQKTNNPKQSPQNNLLM